ncbi:MAG TPA: hypothetical protein VIV11_06475, partial [Kofleriaceae bacterium]
GLLLVYGLAACIGQPIMALGQARSLAQFQAPVGAWFGAAIPIVVALVIGVLALNAGLRMARGQPARRALLVYVIVAIATSVVFHVMRTIYAFTDDMERVAPWLVSTSVIALAVAVARPLLVWWYAKREAQPASGTPVDAALPWIALWLAPRLLARCLLWDELSALVGGGGFVVVAVLLALSFVLILAARDSLRDPAASAPWLVASGFSLVLLLATIYFTWKSDHRYQLNADAALFPATLIFATTATAAWLRRRVTSEP